MTIHVGVLVGLLTVTTLAAWVGVLFLVPSVAVSRYRYALWGMRDELVLALARGKLEPSACLFELMDDLEVRIAHAHQMRMPRVLTSMAFIRRHAETLTREEVAAPPGDAEQLAVSRDLMRRTDVIFLFTSSVTGWALGFIIGVAALVAKFLLRRSPRVRSRVADEVQEAADEISWPRRIDDQDLAAFV